MGYFAMLRAAFIQFWRMHSFYVQGRLEALRSRLGLFRESDLHKAEERGASWALCAATDRDLQVWLADDIVATSADPYNPNHELTAAALCRRMRETTSQTDLDRIEAQKLEDEAERRKLMDEAEARWQAAGGNARFLPKSMEMSTEAELDAAYGTVLAEAKPEKPEPDVTVN